MHVHKYRRKRFGAKKRLIWKCELPDCPHWLLDELIVGRKCICWKCGEELVISNLHRYRVRPKCDKCRGKITPEIETAGSMNELLKALAGRK